MDGSRFDNLTRTLASGTSRRKMLRGLVGGAAGGLLAHFGVREGAAQECRDPGKLCNKDANCCSGLCDLTNPDPFKRKRCLCPNGVPPVNGSCGPVSGPCTEQPNGTPCDDGNLCTQNDTCQNGACVGGNPVVCTANQCQDPGTCNPQTGACSPPTPKASGTSCNDGNLCTTNDVCDGAGNCAGTPVVCTASDACHDAGVCNPDTGTCSNPAKPNGTPCSDNNACTNTDTCQGGVCTPGTAVVCQPLSQCHDAGVCNPATGQCSNPTKPNGSACNDGNACTTGDVCTSGVCGGTAVVCQPLDQCHVAGTCDPSTGVCSNPNAPDNTACNDGNACTQTDTCQGGQCVGSNPVVCTTQNQCQNPGTCNTTTGVCSSPTNKDDGTPCNDGSLCTSGEACLAGQCVGGTPVVCPANQCQNPGICDPGTGICSGPTPKPINTACNDGNACTTNDVCDGAGNCAGTPVVCTPQSQCHSAACNPDNGQCVQTPLTGTPCENPDLCIDGGTCNAGVCTGGTPVVCTPQSQCHSAACNLDNGQCVQTPLTGTACNADDSLCTQNDTCQAGTCVPGTPVVCPANQCQNPGTCNPATGDCSPATPKPINTACNDGNLCTTNDVCDGAGNCAGSPVVCPANQCQNPGTCNPADGQCSAPTNKQDGTACNADDSLCTENDTCQGGVCTPGTPVVCPANQCQTPGTCDPGTGACSSPTNLPNTTPCDDGNPCTTNDVCTDGVCAGTPVSCPQCQQCVAGACVLDAALNGTSCNDGNACTTGDVCADGACVGTPVVCTASDACHDAGTCDTGTGLCSNPPKADGTACNADNSLCTQNDTCQAGLCTPGSPVVCTPLDQCHVAGTCDPATGVCSNPNAPDNTPCNDGNACTQTDTCQAGQCVGGNPVVCTPLDQCHVAGTCDPGTGLCSNPNAPDGTPCEDGLFCTSPDTCQNGVCVGGGETCPTGQCFECDEDNNICTGGCDNEREKCCPGLNGHKNKCCPKEDICSNATSGAVECGNDTAAGTCGGPCRTSGSACDAGLNCIGDNPPPPGGTTLCAPSDSNRMCCVSTGFVGAMIPVGGCPTNNDTCYTQPNIAGACGCFSAYKFADNLYHIDCCDGDLNNPNAGNCETTCAGGICPP